MGSCKEGKTMGSNTEILGGRQYPKDHPLIECLGALDELNAFLGDAKLAVNDKVADIISGIQKDLFVVSGILAGSQGKLPSTEELNTLIKELEANLSPTAAFEIPGENPASAKIHIARTVCRRAERRLVSLGQASNLDEDQLNNFLAWINKLSYLLFILARYV